MWTILILSLIIFYLLMFLFIFGAGRQNKHYDKVINKDYDNRNKKL